MNNVKMFSTILILLSSVVLTGCLESGSATSNSTTTPSTGPALTPNESTVLSDAGCTVAQDGSNVTLTCNGTSATIDAGATGATGAASAVPGPAGATGPQGPQGIQGIQGVAGAAGGMTVSSNGFSLGVLMASLPGSQITVFNPTESVVVSYIAEPVSNATIGFSATMAYMTTIDTIYYSGATCTGTKYVSSYQATAINSLFTWDVSGQHTGPVYKVTSLAGSSTSVSSKYTRNGVCTNFATVAVPGLSTIATAVTALPVGTAIPFTFSN